MRARQKVSRAGVELIKSFEGLRSVAARLPDGRWTLGYGHTFSAREGATVSQEDADALLRFDLLPIVDAINNLVHVPLNQNQFDALVSFCFNIGVENFAQSTVLKRINEGRATEAALAMDAWRSAEFNGQTYVLAPLIRRRAAEKSLFLTPEETGAAATPVLLIRPVEDAGSAQVQPTELNPPGMDILQPQISPERAQPAPAEPVRAPSGLPPEMLSPYARPAPATFASPAPQATPQSASPSAPPSAPQSAPRPLDRIYESFPEAEAIPSGRANAEPAAEPEVMADLEPQMSPQVQAALARAQEEQRLREEALRQEAEREAEALAVRAAEEARLREEARLQEQQRLEAARREQERLEQKRLERAWEQERLERERAIAAAAAAEAARLEYERLERERLELERAATEAARQEVERLEQERLAQERLSRERAERERQERAAADAARQERERQEKLRQEQERQERERQEQDRLQRERAEAARQEQERQDRERQEQERWRRERDEADRVARERAEQARQAAQEEQRRIERQNAEAERAAAEAARQPDPADAEKIRKAEAAAALMRLYSPYGGGSLGRPLTPAKPATASQPTPVREEFTNHHVIKPDQAVPPDISSRSAPAEPAPPESPDFEIKGFTPFKPAVSPSSMPPPVITTLNPYPRTGPKPDDLVEVPRPQAVDLSATPAWSAGRPQEVKAQKTVRDQDAPHWREQLQRPLPSDYRPPESAAPEQANLLHPAAQTARMYEDDNDAWTLDGDRIALTSEEMHEESSSFFTMIKQTLWWVFMSVMGLGCLGVAAGAWWKANHDAAIERMGLQGDLTTLSIIMAATGILFVSVSVGLILKRLGGLKD